MPSDLDGTQCCSHCNTTLNLSNTQSIIIHSSAHILNDGTIGDSDELCGLCLWPSTHCIFRVMHRSGNMYQLDLLHSTCMHIVRSEEHTSELQSLRHLVCRLLLAKKKQ